MLRCERKWRKGRPPLVKRSELTVQGVLEELTAILHCNAQDYFDEDGNPKPLHKLTRAQAGAIRSIEVIDQGGRSKHPVKKIKFWDKMKAIELGFRYFGLIRDFGLDAGEERLQSLTVVFVNAKEGRKQATATGPPKGMAQFPKKF